MKPLWLLASALFSCSYAFAAERPQPPFSNLYRRPVISPYLYADPNFNLGYWSRVQPLAEQQNQEIEAIRQGERIRRIETMGSPSPSRGHGHLENSPAARGVNEGIRPTGHPTFFTKMP